MSTELATEPKGYQGWTNYETWCAALWIDNEYGLYQERLERVQSVVDEQYVEEGRDSTLLAISSALKDWVEEMAPELGATLWSDLLSAALSEINWYEIAEHWIDEADLPETEEEAAP